MPPVSPVGKSPSHGGLPATKGKTGANLRSHWSVAETVWLEAAGAKRNRTAGSLRIRHSPLVCLRKRQEWPPATFLPRGSHLPRRVAVPSPSFPTRARQGDQSVHVPRPETVPPAPLTHDEIRSILVGVVLAMLLAALDQTIVATALPTIGRDLNDVEHLSWI